jgi:hypothetical protein
MHLQLTTTQLMRKEPEAGAFARLCPPNYVTSFTALEQFMGTKLSRCCFGATRVETLVY